MFRSKFILSISFVTLTFGQNLRSCLQNRTSTAQIVSRKDAQYSTLNYQWNVRKLIHPQGFIVVKSIRDIQNVINCARTLNVSITVKSGGHSLEKYSYGSDRHWVVDLKHLNTIRINKRRETVTVGSGVRLKQLSEFLWSSARFSLPLGTCPSVGISGFTLGGGFGLSSRKYGLIVDRLTEVEIVTSDGKLRRANRVQNSDLFWALRGSGGGLFGIVTKFMFRLFRANNRLITISKKYSTHEFISMFDKWQRWVSSQPNLSITSIFQYNRRPEIIFVINNSNFRQSMKCLRKLRRLFPGIHRKDITISNYIQMIRVTSAPFYSQRTRVFQKATNFFVSKVMDMNELRIFAAALRNNTSIQILMEQYGGVINKLRQTSMLFNHREFLYVLQYGFTDVINRNSSFNESIRIGERKKSELHRFTQQIKFLDTGFSYINYADQEFSDWKTRYFSSNFQRLQLVKNKWDPNDFFKFPPTFHS